MKHRKQRTRLTEQEAADAMQRIILILILIACLVFLASSAAHAGWSAWSAEDVLLQATFTALALIDRQQTLEITPSGRREYFSALLGSHPTHERVNRVFIPYIAGHAVASAALDGPWRTGWQLGFILFEANNVRHNRIVGIGATVPF